MGDDTKRALGPGAKCCGDCDLCSEAPAEDEQDDFSWGDDVVLDPSNEEDQ